jgi:HrpA-like RNA helicase
VRYSVEFITKSSAIQRAGRAGRTGPGICYRLYSGKAYECFCDSIGPEILREPLDASMLFLLTLGVTNLFKFPFISKPDIKSINSALERLKSLGALDSNSEVTSTGRMMSRYPVEPRLARLLCVHGSSDIFVELVTLISIISSSLEIRRNQSNRSYFSGQKSDHLVQLLIYNDMLKSGNRHSFCHKMNIGHNSAMEISKMVSYLLKLSGHRPSSLELNLTPHVCDRLRKLLYCGFADQLASLSGSSYVFRGEEVLASKEGISTEGGSSVVFGSIVSSNGRMYMKNITIVDEEWF